MYIIEGRPRINCELGIGQTDVVYCFYPKCQVVNTFLGWHCATSLAMRLLYQQFSVLAAVQALHYLYKNNVEGNVHCTD